ncbi:MAG TPA: UvrD-helicase domain-containing protein [Albitalea sp.]|uniref:UvrD-helicase domain-containing protein n=1 Tax=Piscinibacter sp. TaxID=1903157 RepID=UPI002ECFD931
MSDGMNVEFVRAGAGSGKTYYLTSLLAQRLRDKAARPHAVIATTFTVKAATELRERARNTLLREGRLDLAAAIGQARIGTVNSVCGQLIQRFCFELGISPDQTVVDEDGAKRLMRIAIESVQTSEESAALMALATRMSIREEDLTSRIREIVDLARSNNIGPEHVAAMGTTNADAMLACWPQPDGDHNADLEHALSAALDQLCAVVAAGNAFRVTKDALETVTTALEALRQGRLTWSDWHNLIGLAAGAKHADIVGPVKEIARQHPSNTQFHADVRNYLETLFGLAAKTMKAFEQAKRERGVVDFTDQEVMLLRAIQDSELVRNALQDELDLVLVDEFQDTNPLQLAIFVELAKLSKSSVWVGDQKQAIYGFRGTDSTLVQEILRAVETWGGTLGQPLSESWRSTPELVGLANAVFGESFAPMPRGDVVLTPRRASIPEQPDVLNWSFVRGPRRNSFDFTAMGPAVHGLLQRNLNVYDKQAKQLRPLRAGDIAVLCRKNDHVSQIVEAMGRWGIPAAAERPGLLKTPEARLVLACLRRLHDSADTVASATVVGLTGSLLPEQWLEDRLQFMADVRVDESGRNIPRHRDWKVRGDDAHPLLVRLESLRSRLLSLTPREALRLAKAESGIARLVHQWSVNEHAAQVRIANVEALLALGDEYEDACLGTRQPATVNGLLLWLQERAENERDWRAAAAHGAVEVMTFHKAKGLEWPVVIVAGLDQLRLNELWSVRARTNGAFEPRQPLANRFIHYWPNPFFGWTKKVPQVEAAENSVHGQAMGEAGRAERTRLLYVALTRARDMLVLAGDSPQIGNAPWSNWLDETEGARPLLWGRTGAYDAGGVQVSRENSEWDPDEASVAPPARHSQALSFFESGTPREHAPLWFAPSSANATGYAMVEVENVGTRITVKAGTDFLALGSAVHGCIAYACADPMQPLTVGEVQEILERWGVGGAVEPAAVIGQVRAFNAWWQGKWPQAQAQAEVPLEAKRPDGSIVRGQIDFMLKLPNGRIVIDHKADPRAVGDGNRLADTHGGQLEAYEEAIHIATGEPVLGSWLFLPVAAKAVRIGK